MLYIHIGWCVSRSVVSDFVTLLPVACQTPLSMEFLRQEYWVGCDFLLQGIFPAQGSNQGLNALQANSLPSELPGKPSRLRQMPIDGIQEFEQLSKLK